MTKQIAKITKNGDLELNGVINEHLPSSDLNLSQNINFDSESTSWSGNSSIRTIPEEKCNIPYNLLDTLGIDWRDPTTWGDPSHIKYIEEEDCIEVTGNNSQHYMSMGVPIFPNKKFNVSVDIMRGDTVGGTVYVGGRISNKYGTLNPIHGEHFPGSWNYLAVSGSSSPNQTEWKTYHNTQAGGNPVTGVSGVRNASSWYTDASRWYHPLILANYASGDVNAKMRFKNFRIWYSDTEDFDNTINQANGTAILNSGHTNILSPSTQPEGFLDGWGGMKMERRGFFMPDGSKGFLYKSNAPKVSGIGYGFQAAGGKVKPATKYTLSAIMKCSSWNLSNRSNLIYVVQQNSSGSVVSTSHGVATKFTHIGDGWYIVYGEVTTNASADRVVVHTYLYSRMRTLIRGEITMVEGVHAVTLPTQTPTVSGKMTIPIRSLPTYTIMGKFTNIQDMGVGVSYADGVAEQSTLFTLEDQDGHKIHLRFYIRGDGTVQPFMDPDINTRWNTSGSSEHKHFELDLAVGKNYYWTIRTVSTSILKLAMFNEDGSYISGHNVTTTNSPNLMKIILGIEPNRVWEAIHQSISIYETALDRSEIQHIIKSRINFDDGTVRENISEGMNDKDMIDVDMSEHEDKQFGSGYATTTGKKPNLINPVVSAANGWDVVREHTELVETPYGTGYKYMSGSVPASGAYTYVDLFDKVSIGNTLIFSSWVYVSEDCNLRVVPLILENGLRILSGNAGYDLTKKGTWQFLTARSHAITAGRHRVLTYPRRQTTGVDEDVTGYCIYAALSVTTGNSTIMPSCGLNSNISSYDARSMFFHLNRDYGLDFSKSWTISYWKMPIHDQNGQIQGYGIDSLGGGSGNGYKWWGKTDGQTKIYPQGTITHDEYYNHWRKVTVSYNESTHDFMMFEQNEFGFYNRTENSEITDPKYYTSNKQDESDLQLGGWQETNNIGAIYRDLKIGQIATTEAEAKLQYAEAMRQTEESLSLTGEVIESTL